ncbi:toll/interleukin-1 receptor domain-containing protein [Pseudomonas cichorii]|nr:toll/interleukin-1 receptor domain-containing protein [Pseudomonas cichorii]MBX8490920.1 toll/interleukin-1 receptor domain-containing protein [Pseudomonas cichorii]MBX8509064.1 toll/interleukin-1 receptor domain-containing protein [Pseudomonas cichorii]MBX8524626.1 toll/interleukin-1 receptor domain-containing protein [Pseudomonas cichorii]
MAAFTPQLKKLVAALPFEYDKKIVLDYYKKFFYNQWLNLVNRYDYYLDKDQYLVSVGKRKRYNHSNPDDFFYSLSKVKYICSDDYKLEHKKSYCEDRREKAIKDLAEKIKKPKAISSNLQFTDPYHFNIFTSAYHKRGATQHEKIEIVNELKKFKTPGIIKFFQKLNDSERNNQIRNIAFEYLQSINAYVRKRKSFKGNTKEYYLSNDKFIVTPADLADKLKSGSIQSRKVFDLFISHSYKDNDLVRRLLPALNENGFNIYCDWTSDNDFLRRELISEYTETVIKTRIEQSARVLFLQTKNSVNENGVVLSPWVKIELEHASIINKEILCINLTPLPPLFADMVLEKNSTWGI